MSAGILIRPMTPEDVDAAYHTFSLALAETAEEKEQIRNRTPDEVESRKERYRHSLKNDPEGSWIAVAGDRMAGVALALVREGVWVLSLLAVDEAYRNAGVGRGLIDRALECATGCKGGMIAASTHPAALRCYALAGFTGETEIHWITGQQNWAVSVALEAGLSLSPAGPICVRGELGSLTPYLPSGPFL